MGKVVDNTDVASFFLFQKRLEVFLSVLTSIQRQWITTMQMYEHPECSFFVKFD